MSDLPRPYVKQKKKKVKAEGNILLPVYIMMNFDSDLLFFLSLSRHQRLSMKHFVVDQNMHDKIEKEGRNSEKEEEDGCYIFFFFFFQ